MKKFVILSFLICLTILCSCQKQDSTAEQEFAQRKTELDARENALDERMNALDGKVKALDERVRALAENQKTMGGAGLTGAQGATPDLAQQEAEREKIQQFSTQMRARMVDPQRLKAAKAEKERLSQERRAQMQPSLEQLQSQKQRKSKMFSGAVFPSPQTNSAATSPTEETTSPASSPAIDESSPTPSPTP